MGLESAFNLIVGGAVTGIDNLVTNRNADKYATTAMFGDSTETVNAQDAAERSVEEIKTMTFVNTRGEQKNVRVRIRKGFYVNPDTGYAEDVVFRGKVRAKMVDGSWKEKNIYMYYPQITEESTGRLIGPIIQNGKAIRDYEYRYIDQNGETYYGFYPMCEVTSGMPDFDMRIGASYMNCLQVEMEKDDHGNLVQMDTSDASIQGFNNLWEEMNSDSLNNSEYWKREFIYCALSTNRQILKNMPSVPDSEIPERIAAANEREVRNRNQYSFIGRAIDFDNMRHFYGIGPGPMMRPGGFGGPFGGPGPMGGPHGPRR